MIFPAPAMVLSAVVSIQIGAALASQLFPALGALGTVAWRVLFAALILLLVARPRLRGLARAELGLLLLFGVVVAAMNAFFYLAIERLPLGVVVTIEFLGPLGVGALRATRWLERIWVALALLGVALLAPFSGADLDPVGLVFAVLSGSAWGSFVLLSTRVGRVFPGSAGIALGMGIAALLLLPWAVDSAATLFAGPRLLGTVLAVALLSTAVPFALEFHALRRLSSTVYGTLISLEPAMAAIAGALILGEVLGMRALLAIACVTVAAIGSSLVRAVPAPAAPDRPV
ncbi:MAG TPA: EamA family transporter [Pseudomonadales bacterium]|nr:EamA family transporter [Pseudomonadales bacterium]